MASSMMSSVVAPRVITPTQATSVAPFIGLKSAASFPATKRANVDITSIASNGGRVQCMQVWPPRNNKKFETLSYLPDLSIESLTKEIQYLLDNKWVPCLEFTVDEDPFVHRKNNKSSGYYDGRYWTMWKLPMFGCTDPAQVIREVEEAKKAYPDGYVRLLGFDNVRQVQCISIVVVKPKPVSA